MSRHLQLPGPTRGLSIGLFGGSFNPAHEGHLHVAQTAMTQARLDYVWWIVAAGNPLKSAHGDFDSRLASARNMARHPRMLVTDIERAAGVQYSADLLDVLLPRANDTRFVWIMGADNLALFHRWQNWRGIMATLPLAIVARPGSTMPALTSRAARQYAGARTSPAALAHSAAPAWAYLTAPLHPQSSSAIRASKGR